MNYDLIKKYPHNLIKLEKTVWGEKFVSNRMKKRFPFGHNHYDFVKRH